MSRDYVNIKEYENEIIELRQQGLTRREIGEKLGFTKTQIKDFLRRYKENQRKLAEGIVLRKKGRPKKNDVNQTYPKKKNSMKKRNNPIKGTMTTTNKSYVGWNIRTYRYFFHLSQLELARRIGIRQCRISQYEREITLPSGMTLCKIADVFGVLANTLLSEPIDWTAVQAHIDLITNDNEDNNS